MLTRSGPKTLEYNCRFGDPETEAVLPLLQSDLYDVVRSLLLVLRNVFNAMQLEKCVAGRLAEAQVQWSSGACAAVVCASKGYPGEIVTRVPIRGLDALPCECFHAGSKLLPSNEVRWLYSQYLNFHCR